MPKDLHTLDLTWPFWGALALVVAWSFTREDRRERVLDGLASYRLSVASLGGLFLISWLGTVAQVDVGLFRAQKIYFESWFFTERVGLFGDWRLALPLPGGQLLMSLLAVNLLVGGLVRVGQRYAKARGTRRGILLSLLATHLGVVVLLAAGIVKLHASDNGHVTLYEGESTSEFVSFHEWEVAIHDASQKEQVEEWIVPQEDFLDLERGSRRFETAELPFDLVLEQFAPNARVLPQGDHPGVAVGAVDGWALVPQEMRTSTSATSPGSSRGFSRARRGAPRARSCPAGRASRTPSRWTGAPGRSACAVAALTCPGRSSWWTSTASSTRGPGWRASSARMSCGVRTTALAGGARTRSASP
jgi:hypothetical protein